MPSCSYEDFEPYCTWDRQDQLDTLVLHLPEFKKSDLKIQINKVGILTITGERPVHETSAKRRRFVKQLRLSKDYKEEEIHAKLVAGLLYITMPKKFASVPINEQQPKPKPQQQQEDEEQNDLTNNKPDNNHVTNKNKMDNIISKTTNKAVGNQKSQIKSASSNKMCKEMGYEFGGLEKQLSEYSVYPKLAIAAAAALVVVGAYVTYKKCRSSPT